MKANKAVLLSIGLALSSAFAAEQPLTALPYTPSVRVWCGVPTFQLPTPRV